MSCVVVEPLQRARLQIQVGVFRALLLAASTALPGRKRPKIIHSPAHHQRVHVASSHQHWQVCLSLTGLMRRSTSASLTGSDSTARRFVTRWEGRVLPSYCEQFLDPRF